jgi:predicted cupin superfamily sugar epimerase
MGLSKDEWAARLKLVPHVEEGGYYSEQYRSGAGPDGVEMMDTIYYMLTDDSSVGHFHRNRSDIVHFFHVGAPLRYTTIDPGGGIDTFVLGPDPSQGHQLQRVVRGGLWKATELCPGDAPYGLISEAVTPAFAAKDRTVASRASLRELFPRLPEALLALARD